MFRRSIIPRSWSESDWLTAKVDKFVSQCQGYTKLRTCRLSKGCQTMLDRPSPLWKHTESGVPEVSTSHQTDDNINVNMSSLTLAENDSCHRMNFYQKQLQYDEDIANYIAYLNKPVINLNDHYIEIHQYHYEPTNFPREEKDVPVRPPTRRKKHRIDVRKTEVVEDKGINNGIRPMSPEYSEFLVKKVDTDQNRNIRIMNGRSSDEENKKPEEELDEHRPLTQKPPGVNKVDTEINSEGLVRVKRNLTFTARTSLSPEGSQPLRGFTSFRTARKNKSGRRKKVVVGDKGLDGPIWPAVLLTFDRTANPEKSLDESKV